MFSCEYCEFFKNSFFIEHLWRLPLNVNKKTAKIYRIMKRMTCLLHFLFKNKPRISVKMCGSATDTFSCEFCEIFETRFFLSLPLTLSYRRSLSYRNQSITGDSKKSVKSIHFQTYKLLNRQF